MKNLTAMRGNTSTHIQTGFRAAHFKTLSLLLGFFSVLTATAQPPQTVSLKWVDDYPVVAPTGVSWGVPWPRGAVQKDQVFTLVNGQGQAIPVQTWTNAWWPDGSVKWTGFAAVTESADGALSLQIKKEKTVGSVPALGAEGSRYITINTGNVRCMVSKTGSNIIDSLWVDGRYVAGNGHLDLLLQKGPVAEDFKQPPLEHFTSRINNAVLEQNGPVRAVVKIDGNMQSHTSQRRWLPFSIRLYFYKSSNSVRMVNTVVYDGDQQQDFIKGLGLVFSVPLRDEWYNRHVRFAGEGSGMWAEPVRPLYLQNRNILPGQLAGEAVHVNELPARSQALVNDFPVWNDFRLEQHNADGFNILKRTNRQSTWLDAHAGQRARGFVFVGDGSGGLGVGLKDFWQSYPAALEVRDAATSQATLKVWLWSPWSGAMDMRHYDTTNHGLAAVYEDVQPGLSTPYGIARTSELTLFPTAGVPSNQILSHQALLASKPPVLSAMPQHIHAAKVFGAWSLPDRSTPGKQWIENQLDTAINFYKKEIDQRGWYGYWNYGDVMHTYDDVRHTWRYDVGGYAWDNTELSTDMWFWYAYLRSGRADLYRMAEAMTRHTSEVDVYHVGELAGLGSRHNVRHWGCGSKEVRESQAAYRRFYYYLTTDERTGDMMREVAATADEKMVTLDPLRLILPKSTYPTHSRVGPDWLALVGNWMTEWERTGNSKWRDMIMAGVHSFASMPAGFFSGKDAAFGYSPATKKMYTLSDTIGSSHLSVLMGGPEVVFELKDLLQDKTFDRLWLQFATMYGSSREAQLKEFGTTGKLGTLGPWYARLPAYVAATTNNPQFAATAWNAFLAPDTRNQFTPRYVAGASAYKPLVEVPGISTNHTAQWCLNAIQLLQMIGDDMPGTHPFWSKP